MQKTFTEDFLTKRIRKNNGELKQYYVKESHDAIITPEVFDLVQSEMKSRHKKHGRKDGSVFNGKVVCAKCGRAFSRYLWHSTDKYRKYVWHCSKSHTRCKSGNFSEDELKEIAKDEINKILEPDYKKAMMILDESAFSTKPFESKRNKLQNEMSLLADKISDIIKKNASTGENLEAEYNELASKYRKMENELNEVCDKIESLKASRIRAENFIKEFERIKEPLAEFDDEVFCHLIDRIEIGGKGDVRVVWKGLCKD